MIGYPNFPNDNHIGRIRILSEQIEYICLRDREENKKRFWHLESGVAGVGWRERTPISLLFYKNLSATTIFIFQIGTTRVMLILFSWWLAFVDSLHFQDRISIKYADEKSTLLSLPYHQTKLTTNTPTTISFLPSVIGQALIDECNSWLCDNQMQLKACETKVVNISLKEPTSLVHQIEEEELIGSHLNFSHHGKTVKKLPIKNAIVCCYWRELV